MKKEKVKVKTGKRNGGQRWTKEKKAEVRGVGGRVRI